MCESCFLPVHLLVRAPEAIMCPWKAFEWPGGLVRQPWALTHTREEGHTPYCSSATSVGPALPPDPFQNTSADSFLEQTPSFTFSTACPTPRTLSPVISSLPHIRAFPSLAFLVTPVVTCMLLPQKSSALSDFCLPHPWWAFGCSTSSTAHKWSKKGVKRANPVTLIPTPPSLCFNCQMGLTGTRKVQAWDISQIQLTTLPWITSRKTHGVVVGTSQNQPQCFSSAGAAPQVVLRGWKWGSSLGSALCMGMSSKVTRNAEALGVTDKGWLGQMIWEMSCREQTPEPHSSWKKNQPKGLKGDKFLTNHTFPAIPTNCPQEIYLLF